MKMNPKLSWHSRITSSLPSKVHCDTIVLLSYPFQSVTTIRLVPLSLTKAILRWRVVLFLPPCGHGPDNP